MPDKHATCTHVQREPASPWSRHAGLVCGTPKSAVECMEGLMFTNFISNRKYVSILD